MRSDRLVLVMVAMAAVGACGGDDREPLTEDEWVAEANAICADLNAELSAIPEPQDATEMAASGEQVITATRAMVDRLRALEPPRADEAAVAAMLDAFDEVADTSEVLIDAMVAVEADGSVDVDAALLDLEDASATARRLAAGMGLDECLREE